MQGLFIFLWLLVVEAWQDSARGLAARSPFADLRIGQHEDDSQLDDLPSPEIRPSGELLQQLAEKSGLSVEDLAQKLAQVLPQAVDKLTPNGVIPKS